MKITTIKCEHTRQVEKFEPVRFELSATITEGEDPIKAATELQRLVLMVTYKDNIAMRDRLIKQLVDCEKPAPVQPKANPDAPNFNP